MLFHTVLVRHTGSISMSYTGLLPSPLHWPLAHCWNGGAWHTHPPTNMERGSRDPGIKLHCFGQSASLLGHTSGYILVDMRLFLVWEVLEHRSEVLEHRSEVLEHRLEVLEHRVC